MHAPSPAVCPPSTQDQDGKNPKSEAHLTAGVTDPDEDLSDRRGHPTPHRRTPPSNSLPRDTENPPRDRQEDANVPPRGRQSEPQSAEDTAQIHPHRPRPLVSQLSGKMPMSDLVAKKVSPSPVEDSVNALRNRVRFLLLTLDPRPLLRRGDAFGTVLGKYNNPMNVFFRYPPNEIFFLSLEGKVSFRFRIHSRALFGVWLWVFSHWV